MLVDFNRCGFTPHDILASWGPFVGDGELYLEVPSFGLSGSVW